MIALYQTTGEVTDDLITTVPVSGWQRFGIRSLFCPQNLCFSSRKLGKLSYLCTLTMARLWQLDKSDYFQKLVSLGVPSLQWFVPADLNRSEEEQLMKWRQARGKQSKRQTVLSHLTEELLWLKRQKKLKLLRTERCLNTECIAACCVWGSVDADRSEGPSWRYLGTRASEVDHTGVEKSDQLFFHFMFTNRCVCVA